MPKLQKVVKSIILHDGMGDHVDRFLLEPPAVDYAENLRVDKEGSLQKRPGFESLGTVPNNTDSTPSFIHAIGDSVHTITKTGIQTYDGSSWSETAIDGFLGTKRAVFSSPNFVGLSSVQTAPLFSGSQLSGFLVAYEVRRGPTNEYDPFSRESDVYVLRYTADGSFVAQWKYANAHSPRLQYADDVDEVGIFYVLKSTGQIQFRFMRAQLSEPGSQTNLGLTANTYPRSQNFYAGPGASDYITKEANRLGSCVWGESRYQVTWIGGATLSYFVAAELVTGIWLSKVSISGNVSNTTLIADSANRSRPQLMAIDGGDANAFVLYQTWDREAGFAQQRIRAARCSATTAANLEEVLLYEEDAFDVGRVITHGSIKTIEKDEGTNEFLAAWHIAGYSATSEVQVASAPADGLARYSHWYNVRDKNTRTSWIRVNYSTPNVPAVVGLGSSSAHRLTTNVEYYDGNYYVGLQQWIDHTPSIFQSDDWNQYMNVLSSVKPVTTLLCKLDATLLSKGATPVASLDAGESSHVDYGESEMAMHLASLDLVDGKFYIANRVKLAAETMTMYLGSQLSVLQRATNVDSWSDSLCRVHEITPSLEGVQSAAFGDGVVLNTAVPLWFDGQYFAELGPLESPEILRVEDAYHAQQWNFKDSAQSATGQNMLCRHAYEPMTNQAGDTPDNAGNIGALGWRKMQVVYGYVDSRGNVHRSAPSAIHYVYDLVESGVISDNATRNAGNNGGVPVLPYWGSDMTVYFTTPLTRVPSGVEYFAELYVSRSIDDDPVLVAHAPISRSLFGAPASINTQLNRASTGDQFTLQPIERATRGLYTAGGDLAADLWPAFSYCVVTSTRLFAIDSTNRGRVLVSKLFEDYVAPEYNAELAVNLGDERKLTAIGKLDDKVIVFEPGDIHVIYGDGPNNRGEGNDFAVHYIATDVGCEDQESVIETPVGLMFYSKPRGFYLLDRNMQVQFVGSGIEDTARDIDIVSATLVRDRAEIRFVFTGGPTERLGPDPDTTAIDRPPRPVFTNVPPATGGALTYNYEKNTWMVFSNYDVAAATVYQQRYTVLRNDWEVWQESRTRFDDPSGSNTTDLWTPWVKLTEQVQDFVLLWRMKVLGRYLSSLQDLGGGVYEAGDIQVEVYYDYETTPSQTKRFRVQDFAYNPFNETPRRVERLQFEIDASRGYCQAVKLRFTEIPSESMGEPISYALGRGFEISAVDFEMGARPSLPMLSHGVRK